MGKHNRIYFYLFPVGKWKNLHFNFSQDLSFVKCLQFHPGAQLLLSVDLAKVLPERWL